MLHIWTHVCSKQWKRAVSGGKWAPGSGLIAKCIAALTADLIHLDAPTSKEVCFGAP